mgnify:CR=1 FL=1
MIPRGPTADQKDVLERLGEDPNEYADTPRGEITSYLAGRMLASKRGFTPVSGTFEQKRLQAIKEKKLTPGVFVTFEGRSMAGGFQGKRKIHAITEDGYIKLEGKEIGRAHV